MLKVTKEQQGETLVLRLGGSITEGLDLKALCGFPLPKSVRVLTKEVDRINSEGVKLWMLFFKEVTDQGTVLAFAECSTAIMEQVNLVKNFLAGGKVESAYMPYACRDCKTRLVALVPVSEMRKMKLAGMIPDLRCTKCGKISAVFDDLPDEYLRFLSYN